MHRQVIIILFVFLGVAQLGETKFEENKYFAFWPTPEQVHLSLGASPPEMVVTWVTLNATWGASTVIYGPGTAFDTEMNMQAHGSQTEYLNEGYAKRYIYIHQVALRNLQYNTTYRYMVGNAEQGWSNSFFFTTLPQGTSWQPNVLVIGDLGNIFAYTLGAIQQDAVMQKKDKFHFAIHLGDFAYDLNDNDGKMADAFFRQIEPVASSMPYQVCAGNHEFSMNFSQYDNRFAMYSEGSSEKNNWFWSYNIGPIHFVFFNTEFYYFKKYGTMQIMNQYRWLEEDLRKANQNRASQPWIVTVAHRPLYNQNYINNVLRVGTKDEPGVEKLLHQYGVDLTLWGHDHIYERMWPIYDKKVMNGSGENPYHNPPAPVHIITGSAGCALLPPPLNNRMPHFNAVANRDFSYTRLKVESCNKLHLHQINNRSQQIDFITITKDKHGTYSCP